MRYTAEEALEITCRHLMSKGIHKHGETFKDTQIEGVKYVMPAINPAFAFTNPEPGLHNAWWHKTLGYGVTVNADPPDGATWIGTMRVIPAPDGPAPLLCWTVIEAANIRLDFRTAEQCITGMPPEIEFITV